MVGANRMGSGPYYIYAECSVNLDPQGEILADVGGREGCIRAQLDLAGLRKYRADLPFIADRKST